MSSITVTPNLQIKSVSSSTSAQTIIPDGGYCRLRQVNISAFSGTTVTTLVVYPFTVNDLTYSYSAGANTPHLYSYSRKMDDIPSRYNFNVFSKISFNAANSNYGFSFENGVSYQWFSEYQQTMNGTVKFVVHNISSGGFAFVEDIVFTSRITIDSGERKITMYLTFNQSAYSFFTQIPKDTQISYMVYCI